jgi:undecaprenyl phosphate N,N'-diacetylbacillosamine 1-phosphate transferase
MIYLFAKRTTDITGSLIGLAVLSLPMSFIAVLVKLNSRGPVFFRQERIGKDGKAFLIWKYRTMVVGAVNMGLGMRTSKEDDRITRVGRVLRAFSLDELPQLVNVLKGDMSLIGPRPTVRSQVEQYTPRQKKRLLMRPGITSLASVNGRNDISWAERIELDIKYIEHVSLFMDLRIFFKTFWVAFITREGVYASEGANDDFVRQDQVSGA